MAPKNKFKELHLIKFELFKEQNPESGLFDVIFEVEGKVLYAHKNMLNLVSPTFASMLSERWMKEKDAPIKIKNYSYGNFYQFLAFLYSGECELSPSNISSMVDMAEFYGVALFKDYCDEFLSSMEITVENVFQLMELAEKYSMVQFKTCLHGFITHNFQSLVDSAAFLNLSKDAITELIVIVKDKIKPDHLFEGVYKWTEKQLMDKQAADPTLNLQDAIKAEFTDFLPHIYFRQMKLSFLHEFVVSRGFIFSTFKELSKILCERNDANFGTKVKVTNNCGQTLHGNLILDKSVIENIKSLKNQSSVSIYGFWNTQFNIPSTPSPLKKKDGIEWYLVYYPTGEIGVIRSSEIRDIYYLFAELTPGTSGFEYTENCLIDIE